ncbi:MAG: DUF4965 domain-containing protein [Terracidiphilus sp.]|nr:DUF4965 domain-containing protein [Terracidiphilus sp.]
MKRFLCVLSAFALILSSVHAQQRPPAVPLIVHNPYFSVWSTADKLTDRETTHWTGARQPIAGIARIDGKAYRFMGDQPHSLPAMEQTALQITPTHTVYTFRAAQIALTVDFFTPALPRDLDLLSRPVTYLTFTASGEGQHEVSILVDADPVIAVNTADQPVIWSRAHTASLTVLSAGSRDQQPLNRPGDDLRIDWGYFRMAVPDSAGASFALVHDALSTFVKSGSLPDADQLDMPRMPRGNTPADQAAHLAAVLPLGKVGTSPVRRHILFAYIEDYAIEYLGRKLRPYWQRNGMTAAAMLDAAEKQFPDLQQRGAAFDRELTADLEKAGGPGYARLAILSYRQTLAAHGFAADFDGTPLMFPKENFSNGCISTVDVLYPSAPFFLFFNPVLLEAQLKPVMEYAALPRWRFPFAPHDLGTYPLANGQVYGGGELTEENQMPVEESGNMLILAAAMEQELGNWDFARQYWAQFSQWAEYLRDKGLDPANQLSTDDFAGHLAHNANLSIKAIDALAAYAQMAEGVGKPDVAAQYRALAQKMASQWQTLAIEGDHYKLAFDKPGSWSQKYNLVWDQLLGFNLFPASVRQTEMTFYLNHLEQFGLPLDSRRNYTKLDWEIWTATLAANPEDFQKLLKPIGRWIDQGPTRVPLTDWYDTKDGRQQGFQARSVVGGVYIKALADPVLAAKWRNRPAQ